jgi:hypothetical protein
MSIIRPIMLSTRMFTILFETWFQRVSGQKIIFLKTNLQKKCLDCCDLFERKSSRLWLSFQRTDLTHLAYASLPKQSIYTRMPQRWKFICLLQSTHSGPKNDQLMMKISSEDVDGVTRIVNKKSKRNFCLFAK